MLPDKDRIEKWLDALRSGEFEQASYALHGGLDARCCLGVACEVYHRETGKGIWTQTANDDFVYFTIGEEKDWATMPTDVYEWFGLPSANPDLPGFEGSDLLVTDPSAAEANDSGATFAEIADALKGAYLS